MHVITWILMADFIKVKRSDFDQLYMVAPETD